LFSVVLLNFIFLIGLRSLFIVLCFVLLRSKTVCVGVYFSPRVLEKCLSDNHDKGGAAGRLRVLHFVIIKVVLLLLICGST